MDFQPTVGRIPKKKSTHNIHIFNMGCLDSPNKPVKKASSTNKLIFNSLWE